MKTFAYAIAAVVLAAAFARGEMLYVVKITDFARNAEYKLMTGAEKSELQRVLQNEQRVFPKVLQQLKKEWEEDELSRDEPFPSAKLSARKMEAKGPFDAKTAQKKLEALEERAMDDAFDTGSKKKKEKSMTAKQREAAKAREAKDAAKEAAAGLLSKKIQERVDAMLNPSAATDEGAPAAEAAE